MKPKIVIDKNVLIAGLLSRKGASFRVLELISENKFDLVISVPLILEYEEATKRKSRTIGLTYSEIDDILDYICFVADLREVFYLWRPFLKDPNDDMILELAVEAECDFIVTHNIRDFAGSEKFGIHIITPREFLREIGDLP
ncbi:MAG: putative toxin-antitoxin system toxin component, PIN family [Candidatus Glassbacteria bacterium]